MCAVNLNTRMFFATILKSAALSKKLCLWNVGSLCCYFICGCTLVSSCWRAGHVSDLLAHPSVHGLTFLLLLGAGVARPSSLGWCLHETACMVGWCWQGQGCSMVNPVEPCDSKLPLELELNLNCAAALGSRHVPIPAKATSTMSF